MEKQKIYKDIVYPQESYEIVGVMYDVWDNLGYGHKESFYQKAIAVAFAERGKNFKEQARCRVNYKGKEVGLYIFDFLYEEKIIIEIKQGETFSKKDIKQIYAYLKATNIKLGLLVHFTRKGMKFKRIVNIN